MAEPRGAGLAWLQRWWRRAREESASHPGRRALVAVEAALEALEAQLCEGLVRGGAAPPSALLAARASLPSAPPRNLFGRPLQEEAVVGAAERVTVAAGMTLAGLRTSVFLGGDELGATHEAVASCTKRLVPLVLHASLAEAGHAGYHALAGSGAFQVLAGSGQEALDWSVVARWLAERALWPGLVAVDLPAVESVSLPADEALRAYLGRPDEPIASPSEAQRLLFGRERPRLLPWFDLDRPVASGGERGVREAERAQAGRQLFFQEAVAELAQQAVEAWNRIAGRSLSFVSEHQLRDAEIVLVGQGRVVETARAVTEHLRRTRRLKVGVLGISWLRPFPGREVARALERCRNVVVVEALGEGPATGTPLLSELREALGAAAPCISAICSATGPEPAALATLCERVRRPDPPRRIDLERLTVAHTGAFPRRQALLQAVSNAYPQWLQQDLPEPALDVPEPQGVRSVALVASESQLPPEGWVELGEAMVAEAGAFVRGTRIRPAPGVIEAHVRVAPAEFDDPGPRAPVEAVWMVAEALPGLAAPLPRVAAGGLVLLATHAPAERAWSALPPAWRHAVREAGLRLLAVEPAFEAGLAAVQAWLRGEDAALLESGSLREVPWRELPDPDARERELPRLVSRIAKVRPAHDSLPRFWGEVVQPRQEGAIDEIPDPLTAVGAVPAGASALAPPADVPVLPLLDPTACSGCGRCWSVCPDSAIGASALDPEALFTAASRLAATSGRAADALRRAHKHLGARLGGELAKDPAAELDTERCRAAWSWLAGRLNLGDEERADYEAAFDATLAVVERLQPVTTAPLLREPEQQKKGAGALLVLAVDPRTCLGCGLCVSACPEDALRAVERTPERIRAFEERWQAWEKLPDTPGETLARAAEHPDVGRMAALLLSRHCAQAQVGGAGGEPGSGERLAARLVTALVEHHAQRSMSGLLKTLAERRAKLEQSVREHLAEGLSAADLDTLEEALAGVTRGRADLSELGTRLDALGTRATFDRRAVLRMTRVAGALDAHRQRLAEGVDGLGRARFGVVVARGRVGAWAARYPRHPYQAPLAVAPTAEAVELARGVARGLVAEHLALIRSLRRAELEAEPPPDRTARLETIEALRWETLETHERAACPPLLLLGDDAALLEHGFEAVTRLLDSGLPVKVVLLDGLGRLGARAEPALLAMAHRRAFVLAASPAHPDALARGLSEALGWPGPALIHVHAPSPQRHGFPPEATLERARLAVEGRAHVLLRYDPAAEGLFGLRASLQGNPEIDQEWGGASFVEWAAGEARFAPHFEPLENGGDLPLGDWLALPEPQREGRVPFVELEDRRLAVSTTLAETAAERLAVWNTLRELTGAVSPFTARIRDELATKLEAERGAELEALRSEHESRIAELRAGTEREALERLTLRLLQLSGFSSGAPPKENGA